MNKEKNDRNGNTTAFWGYAGRFILLHVVLYTIIGGIFLYVQSLVPEARRVALDFEYFSPYRVPGLVSLAAQASRGLILALVFYPFHTTITTSRRGGLPCSTLLPTGPLVLSSIKYPITRKPWRAWRSSNSTDRWKI